MMSLRSRIKVLNEIAEAEKAEYRSPEELVKMSVANEAKREKRRRRIVKELFDTEKTYQNLLDIIHRFFYFPLRFDCIIPEDVHNKLFSNVEQIQNVNMKLLDQMEENTIGQAFLFLGPFLKLYSTYANNHSLAVATFQEWLQKSAKFAEFIESQEARPEVMGLKFNALIITPVQRVPRYKLLLEDLLEHTPTSHYDYYDLQEATKQICNIAIHINEHIRQHENFQKMLTIQRSLGTTPKILSPGREFIREGTLRKVTRKGDKSHDRMFFLFSDMLIYAKPKLLKSDHSYSCSCVLPLRHCSIQRLFEDNKQLHSGGMFQISCKEVSIVLYSLDLGEVTSWIDSLETAIKKLSDNRQTLRKPSSNKVPLRGRTLLRQKKLDKKNSRKQVRPTLQRPPLLSRNSEEVKECTEGAVQMSTPRSRSNSPPPAPFRESDSFLDASFKRKWEEEVPVIEKQLMTGLCYVPHCSLSSSSAAANDAVKEDLRKLRLPMELTMDRGSRRAAVQERTRNPLSNYNDKFITALMEDANLPECRWPSSSSPAGVVTSSMFPNEMDSFMLVDESLTANVDPGCLTPDNKENLADSDETPHIPLHNLHQPQPRPLSHLFESPREESPPPRYKSLNSVFNSTRRRFHDKDQRCSIQ